MKTLNKNEVMKLLKWNIQDCRQESKKQIRRGNLYYASDLAAKTDVLEYVLSEIKSGRYDTKAQK